MPILPLNFSPKRAFSELSEREVLALAIQLEELDGRIYRDYAEGLRDDYPASAEVFADMAREEDQHRRRLIDLFQKRFGDHIPLVRPDDVKGFVQRKPLWLARPLNLDAIRRQAEAMEAQTYNFYMRAAARATDPAVRKLLGDLAAVEAGHESMARRTEAEHLTSEAKATEDETQRRLFVLQVVQPGLAGLMDGSVSTLAPVFAAAFATHNSWDAFVVGLAASFGAGISMGFAEALSDDGSLTGRGRPFMRGLVCGLMTAAGVVGAELGASCRRRGAGLPDRRADREFVGKPRAVRPWALREQTVTSGPPTP